MSYPTKKYDVFLSFRGVDTRKNFTSHLYSALRRDGIRTYIDNINLHAGDEVGSALLDAIEDSHIAIAVFSKNYASSKWCLEELVKILECRNNESHGQVVIPVFYEVDPSHVRYQTESYKEAFAKHERYVSLDESARMKVSGWKAALREAANISGFDSRSPEYKNESQFIDEIVKDVSEKLHLKYPTELDDKGLVGIDKIREDFKSLLNNFNVIGIWGMGGIGKTTTAKIVFSQLFPLYDSVCFLANVRKDSLRLGETSLRDKLIANLLKDENSRFSHVGSTFISRKLRSKKVFIVLDDVESLDQLDNLRNVYKYAGPGSKVIITTRNKELLTGRADEIYDANIWTFDECLEIFCFHAFEQRFPQEGYEDCSKSAVDYAGGVPLALKVLGSKLHFRSIEFWDCELKKLNTRHEGLDKVRNVLQVSYDGLDAPEQEIFLDIAFFFKDEKKDVVESILNACDLFATSGIKVLVDKALITISNDKRIQMHDLLQEMGFNIVRQGIEDPEKRSRLRDIGEVYDVLQNKEGSDAIKGITIDLSGIDDLLTLGVGTFSRMPKLRFLKLYTSSDKKSVNVEYPRFFEKLPPKLRYLEWHGYRLKSLPAEFSARLLVEIRMPHSHLTELWKGVKDVVNLEGIDLCESKQLKYLPDLSKASKLKWMNLTGCESLLVVHPSILSLDTIETLILDNCINIRNLKTKKHLRSLKKISVNGCTKLEEFSLSSDKIEMLDLSKTGIQTLHASIGNLRILGSLNLEGLRLRDLPTELSSLKSLRDLRISNCRLTLDKLNLHALFEGLTSLRILYLMDCCNLRELPDNINKLSVLYELRLDGSSVERLPESISLLYSLEIISLNHCMKLQWLPKLPLHIKNFNATNCSSLTTLSSLNTFALGMNGNEKYISFQNCVKLHDRSLRCLMEDTQLTMMNAIAENRNADSFGLTIHSYNYNHAKVCLPGSRVPGQLTYRTTDSSFTITLPSYASLLGIMFCAVLSPSEELKKHGARIWCQCYLPDGTKVGHASTPNYEAITELSSDHVYVWCDPFHFDSIFRGLDGEVLFEFYVTNDKEEPEVLDIRTKECGVLLVIDSDDLRHRLKAMYHPCLLASEVDLTFGTGIEVRIAFGFGMAWRYIR